MDMSLESGALARIRAEEALTDFEEIFRAHYERIALVLVRVVGDRARAEEIAVDVFLRLWRAPIRQATRHLWATGQGG